MCLAEGIQEIIPSILKSISTKLALKIERSKNQQDAIQADDDVDATNLDFMVDKSGCNEYGDFSDLMYSQMYHTTILLDLNINPLIRSRLLSTPMIQALAAMLDMCDVNSFKGAH